MGEGLAKVLCLDLTVPPQRIVANSRLPRPAVLATPSQSVKLCFKPSTTGSLKDTFAQLKHGFFHQDKGKPPCTRQCSGVFHVRIPAFLPKRGTVSSGWERWLRLEVHWFGFGFGFGFRRSDCGFSMGKPKSAPNP